MIDTNDDECNICFEKYNLNSRKKVMCPYCNRITCCACTKKYLLTSYDDPHCMNCRAGWNMDFFADTFTKQFINVEYKKHRQNVLIDREMSLLPATQSAAEEYKQNKIIRKKMSTLTKTHSNLLKIFENALLSANNIDNIDMYNKLKKLHSDASDAHFEYLYNRRLYTLSRKKKRPNKKQQFIRACPANNCRGMLSTKWKCALCGIYVCPKCHEILGVSKDAKHECKQENIDSVTLLNKDTKPCPKCASLIYRVSGCSQMWCTTCNTAFDWTTLEIITHRRIHNPHFFEWQRAHNNYNVRLGDQDNNEQCELPDEHALHYKLYSLLIDEKHIDFCMWIPTSILHNTHILEHNFILNDILLGNQDLRIKYLLHEIDDTRFKQQLFVREKINAKNLDVRRLIELVIQICTDYLIKIYATTNKTDCMNILGEIRELIKYVNKQLSCISEKYNMKVPIFDSRRLRFN